MTIEQKKQMVEALENLRASCQQIETTLSECVSREIAAEPGEEVNCYRCKHRGALPGSAHSVCRKAGAVVDFNGHGVKMGWACWPTNFDPVWVDSCSGFEPIKPVTADDDTTCYNECYKCGAPIDPDLALCNECGPSGCDMPDYGEPDDGERDPGERPNRPSGTWEAGI